MTTTLRPTQVDPRETLRVRMRQAGPEGFVAVPVAEIEAILDLEICGSSGEGVAGVDLVCQMVAGHDGDWHGNGVTRWRGWR